MKTSIIDGKQVAADIRAELKDEIARAQDHAGSCPVWGLSLWATIRRRSPT